MFNHSIRSYLFATLAAPGLSLRPGRDYDDETLFTACLMHDLGIAPEAGTEQRFEVIGADMAVAFLAAHGVDADRTAQVWEAIALHSSGGIAERRGPVTALARTGIGMDFGLGVDDVTDEVAAAIHAAYPRLDMGKALTDAIVAKASGRPDASPAYSLPDDLVRERAAEPFLSRLEVAARYGRWGS